MALHTSTRSTLLELDELLRFKDRENLLESRAANVIASAINLINFIKENYDEGHSIELEKRLLNSIRAQDPAKFTRGIRKIRNEGK